MTKGPILVLLFLSIIPTLADEKPWPQKGDTVYIGARLSGFSPMTVMIPGMGGGKMPDIPALEPCSPTTVKKRAKDGSMTLVKDDDGNDRKLLGNWDSHLHRVGGACREQIKSADLPRVKATGGYRYELVD